MVDNKVNRRTKFKKLRGQSGDKRSGVLGVPEESIGLSLKDLSLSDDFVNCRENDVSVSTSKEEVVGQSDGNVRVDKSVRQGKWELEERSDEDEDEER